MSQEMRSLDSIGIYFGTDKSSWGHDYLRFYEYFFGDLREANLKVLEIGLANGASLRVWEEYFYNSTIIGADINPKVKKLARPRVLIEVVDQSNVQELICLATKHGLFDIIIDDGSHMWEHQITTLKTLFPFLHDGGIYIVEDLHTNFGSLQSTFRGVSSISCIEYLKKLLYLRVADTQMDISKEEDPFLRTYGRKVDFMTFYRQSCLIKKGQAAGKNEALVPIQEDAPMGLFTILAHIGRYGDRICSGTAIRGAATDQNIQGFSIDCEHIPKDDFSYRARLQNGVWTDWVRCGEFVGTRGEGEDLTGFGIRLSGQTCQAYAIELVGAFRGLTTNVIVRGGEDCISQVASAQLWAMQIVMRAK